MTILWLVVFGVCSFVVGFLTHKFIADESNRTPQAYLERLTEDLGLTENQQDAIRKLLSEQDRRMEALKDSDHGKGFIAEMNAAREQTQQGIEGILREDQKKRWKELSSGSSPQGDSEGAVK
jgi:hypothetical protein